MKPACHLMCFVVITSFLVYATYSKACDVGTFRQGNRCVKCGHCLQTPRRPDPCNPISGACRRGCVPGYIEPHCLEKCGSCIGGDKYCLKGVCSLGCEQGFTGKSCNIGCQPGKFGENCKKSCGHCRDGNTTCDSVAGTCAEGCETGWSGLLCSVSCPVGFWGHNCNMKCGNCDNINSCDKATGDCKGQCKSGWRGFSCTDPCPLGRHGKNCLDKCPKCPNKCACNAVTGKCEKECRGDAIFEYAHDTEELLAASHTSKRYRGMTQIYDSPGLVMGTIALVVAFASMMGVFYVGRSKCRR